MQKHFQESLEQWQNNGGNNMREILFKAKTTVKGNKNHAFNNVWVEGNLIISGGKYYIHPIANKVNVEGELGKIIIMHEIIPETLCQYTGLTDKNGKKIWENDIVKFPDCEMSTESGFGDVFTNVGKIAYDTYSMSYFITNRVTVDMDDIDIKTEVEVLGNIFDNAELLEG